MEELDQEKMKMLLEQMNRGPDRSKPVGQQSVGGGVFAPAKTDMGPVGAMSKGVGAINPVAGAASDALLGAVEGASGAIGGVLAAPGRLMSGVGRAIKGLRPFPSGPSRPAPNLSGFSNGMGQLGEMVKSSPPTPQAPPAAPPQAAPGPGFDRDYESRMLEAIQAAPPGYTGAGPQTGIDEEKRRQELLNQYNPYGRRGINPG